MGTFDTSEYKVTYILGAGASAYALPTVKATKTTSSISDTLIDMAEKLSADTNINPSHKDFVTKICEDLNWVAENSIKFGTPDTYAKFLFLQSPQDLLRLKNTLSFFFTIEQFIYNKFDERALIFLSSVMQIGNVFPTNIKILNWNYDFQMQIAAEYFRKEEFHLGPASVHSPPLVGYYPSLGFEFHQNNQINPDEVSMVHLNGIAGFYFYKSVNSILNLFLNEKPKDINEIIEKIKKDYLFKHYLLTFAWEKNTESASILRNRIEYAKKIIEGTNILVVVGYSFPFFNRYIDKQIFEVFKANEKFKYIYYQDPYRTGDFLRNQFDLPDSIEIKHIKDKGNYYIPNEL